MSFDNGVAIRVRNLAKCYHIYNTPRDRLKQFILPRLKRIAGKSAGRYFREFWALQNVSFEIRKGETVGIIGRNGSGKSTLLQLICGTLSPTAGSVETRGRIAALLELGSGFNMAFTGRENVYLNGAVLGLSQKEIDERFDAIVTFADIGEFIDRPVKTYSSGMFVRLAFAIQANVDPEILIVDEALAVGDAYFVQRCMLRFHELQRSGTTILLVSHAAGTIKNLCQRAIWLEGGEVRMIGASEDVTDHYLAHLFDHPVVVSSSVSKTDRNVAAGMAKGQVEVGVGSVHEAHIPNIDRRTGNQAIHIMGVELYNNDMESIKVTPNDTEVILRMTIKNQSIPEGAPVAVGYTFRNSKGVDISSADSVIAQADLGSCPFGMLQTIAMKISLPILYPGNYSISPSAGYIDMESGKPIETDRIQNAIVFEITSDTPVRVGMRFKTEFRSEPVA